MSDFKAVLYTFVNLQFKGKGGPLMSISEIQLIDDCSRTIEKLDTKAIVFIFFAIKAYKCEHCMFPDHFTKKKQSKHITNTNCNS